MRRIHVLLLVISSLIACNSSGTASENKNHSDADNGYPFDRHGLLIFTRHARCRMDCRHITEPEIHEILNNGTINYSKSDPDARPEPKYAVDGFTTEHQHLRIVVAAEEHKLIVVTCIELGVEWTCHCN